MKLASLLLPILSLLLAGLQACAQNPSAPDRSDPAAFYKARAEAYLFKDPALAEHLVLTERGLRIFPVLPVSDSILPETMLYWSEAEDFVRMVRTLPLEAALEIYQAKGLDPFGPEALAGVPEAKTAPPAGPPGEKPLLGWRIALDPGHIGGTMDFAFLEKKFVRILQGEHPEVTEDIAFNEGNLALGTALLLRDSLERLGAEVFLTREKEGQTSFGGNFREWLTAEYQAADSLGLVDFAAIRGRTPEGYPKNELAAACWNYLRQNELHGADSTWWMEQATTRDVYRIPFLKADFRERARRINAFQPHLSLILHYNIWEHNTWDRGKYLRAIDDNYSMAFIPGSFMAGELAEPEDRMLLLYKLLSEDLPESERLSGHVVAGFEKDLQVPAMEWDDSLKYLKNASLRTATQGVFARNLSLTRLVNGPLCFGEALYQDNAAECMALNARDFKLPGMQSYLPNRIRDAVDAYMSGILAYAKEK